jgi:hypothetical protein
LEDNLGNYCHPWAGIIYSCNIQIRQMGVETQPDLPPEAHRTVKQDTKTTNDDNDDDFAVMESGCIVSLSVDADIADEKVYPMDRSVLQSPNHTSRLLLDETMKIAEISDTSNDYSIARPDCESVFNDNEYYSSTLNDPHHDCGIGLSWVVVSTPTFG